MFLSFKALNKLDNGAGKGKVEEIFLLLLLNIIIIIYKMKSKVFAKAVCKASSLFHWL